MNPDDYIIDISSGMSYTGSGGTYTIDVSTITSGYNSGTITLDGLDDITLTVPETTWIDADEVELMCKEYPALEKNWRRFKTMYDLVKQDYIGKKESGELDNDTT